MTEQLAQKDREIAEEKRRAEEFDSECEIVAQELRKTRARENEALDELEALQKSAQALKESLAAKDAEIAELKAKLEEIKASKPKPSPLVPQGQIARSLDWLKPSNTVQKGSLTSVLFSKDEETQNGECGIFARLYSSAARQLLNVTCM